MMQILSEEEDPWFINEDEKDAFEFSFTPSQTMLKPLSKINKT